MAGADDPAATVTLGDSASDRAFERSEPWRAGERIGRYRLIDQLGAGGMGVVYVADDPELDRRVALKLVRPEARSGPATAQVDLVVEAQAMARLQHPNVVTIYDVGIDRGRVFLAMELVAGVTLRDWITAERRHWRQIVSAFVGAARGLAAAHRAGLVHRDFKPDNVLIDRDGAARLTDFGLARPPADHARARAGSPPYMAPEQHDGAPVTEAADQFAFAAALWEAVFGALPFAGEDLAELALAKRLGRIAPPPRGRAPAWLAAVLCRGLAPAPSERFASLTALERALERGLGRRRRAMVAAAAVAVVAGAFVVGGLRPSGVAVAPCGGAAAEIARTWNAEARDRVTGHLRGLGEYATGEAARLSGELAGFADGWATSHREACLASAGGELTAALYEQQLACLERSRMALAAALDVLAQVPRDRLSDAIIAARSLPEASRCRSEALVTALPIPPPARADEARRLASELERVRIRALAREPDAGAAAAAAVTRAEALGHAPLVARAYLIDGLALLNDDAAHAIDAFDRAASTALGAGDDAAFVEAYARELFAIGRTETARVPPPARDALAALPYVEGIAQRLGAAAAFARPLLYNNAGVARRSAGDNAGARAWFEKALAEPRTREGEIELAGAFGNLALVLDDPVRSPELLGDERKILQRLLGPEHVMTLDAELKASIFVAHPGAAAAALGPLCARFRQFHPTTAQSRIALCTYQLGWLAEERGEPAAARTELARIPADDSPQDLVGRAIRSSLADAPDQALREARDAIGRLQGQWWTQIYAVDALIVAAQADVRRGHPDDAIASLRQALTLLDGLAAVETGADRPRRLARVRAQLAILLATRDRPAAQRHAEAAVAWYRQVGGYDAQIAALAGLAATGDSH